MFNTTNLTKLGASVVGALLILLFVNWGASSLYGVGSGEEHGAEGEHVAQGYVIAPQGEASTAEAAAPVEVSFADVFAAADAGKGKKIFKKCKACHKIEDGVNATGPSLYGVVGRDRATEPGFSYSDALIALQGDTWTPEHLNDWLTDPKAYAPGNKMTFKGLPKIEDRANVIAYLQSVPD